MFPFLDTKTALVVAPHPDDAELCAGGTIIRLVEAGVDVHIATVCSANVSAPTAKMKRDRRAEAIKAAAALGILDQKKLIFLGFENGHLASDRNARGVRDRLADLRELIQPSLVIIPSSADSHQDHEVVHKAGFHVFKYARFLLGFENPINSEKGLAASLFVSLTHTQVMAKIHAARRHLSEKDRKHYFDPEYLEALARTRAMTAGPGIFGAEAFEVIRSVI